MLQIKQRMIFLLNLNLKFEEVQIAFKPFLTEKRFSAKKAERCSKGVL